MVKIFIDPGHGGTDSGATGNGLQEKAVTLEIALVLRTILTNEYEGVSVTMSRTSDKTVSLTERTEAANSWGQIIIYPFILTQEAEPDSKAIFTPVSERRPRLTNQPSTRK